MSESNDKGSRRLSLKRGDAAAPAQPRLEERLHKVLAQAGLGSRRALEQRIAEGVVKVNGEVATVGMSVRGGDRIELDGRSFVASALTEAPRVLMYNKPEGEVTTREDPEGRPTIFDALPALKGARWISIGRLDINTTGLLLLTTDGELANAMMHPSHEVAREYVCRVRAPEGEDTVSDKIVDRLRRGVALDDGPASFDAIDRIGGTGTPDQGQHDWFRVLLKEGRNREVRRLWESQGCQVSRLKRVRYGSVELPQPLLRGHTQELPAERVDALRKQVGLEDGTPSALTLQPVIGQRKAAKSTVHVGGRSGSGYVGGHNTADEGRELRRFDHVREDRRGGRGRGKGGHGGLTVSGEAAAKQANKAFKPKGPRQPGQNARGGKAQRGPGQENPAAFRTWYVPDGVETGPSGHRNPDGARGPRRGSRNGPAGGKPRNGSAPGARRDQRPGGIGKAAHPYGHPGNAPSFPSDHANPGSFNPYGDRPRAPRPGARPGARPGSRPPGKPSGARPGGPRGPGKPGGGNRGPRGGGGDRGGR